MLIKALVPRLGVIRPAQRLGKELRLALCRFRDEVEVVATMERWWPHLRWVDEGVTGGGREHGEGSLIIEGAMANFFHILATSMNFT